MAHRAFVLGGVLMLSAIGAVIAAPATDTKKPIDIRAVIKEKCGGAPMGVVALDGKTASKAEMDEAKFQVVSFMSQSDVFQDCVLKAGFSVKDRLTPTDKAIIGKVIQENQEEKTAVADGYNQAVDQFNAAHGGGASAAPAPATP